MRVLHVISGLGKGGAETMLIKLSASRSRYRHEILSLAGMGVLGEQIQRLGIPLHTVAFDQPARIPASFIGLGRLINAGEYALIVAWMNHGIIFTTLARQLTHRRTPLIWNVRQTLGDINCEKPSTRAIIKANARLSHVPQRIIYNSVAGARDHEAIGFDPSKRVLISNGFALDTFYPDPVDRAGVRGDLAIDEKDVVFGLFARFHPMKNHAVFLRAAEMVRRQRSEFRLLLAGLNVHAGHPEFAALFPSTELRERSIMLGSRDDMPRLARAMDVACNVSFHGEGFSNSIGEAMASGVPCLVTDTGDSAAIVGDTGVISRDASAEGIAEAILRFLDMSVAERRRMGQMARRRIEQHYSLPAIVEQYEELFDTILAGCEAR